MNRSAGSDLFDVTVPERLAIEKGLVV